MNQKYWDDLTAEGRELTRVAEGEARDLKVPLHVDDRAAVRKLADTYRSSVRDTHYRNPDLCYSGRTQIHSHTTLEIDSLRDAQSGNIFPTRLTRDYGEP